MVIGVAEDVLFDVFALTGVVFVLHPQRQREVGRQIVAHHVRRNLHSRRSVKHVHLINIHRNICMFLKILLKNFNFFYF